MKLVSDVGWSGVTLAALARNQEIDESELENLFSDKIGLLQAFSEFIDEQTLANLDPDIFDPEISKNQVTCLKYVFVALFHMLEFSYSLCILIIIMVV